MCFVLKLYLDYNICEDHWPIDNIVTKTYTTTIVSINVFDPVYKWATG